MDEKQLATTCLNQIVFSENTSHTALDAHQGKTTTQQSLKRQFGHVLVVS